MTLLTNQWLYRRPLCVPLCRKSGNQTRCVFKFLFIFRTIVPSSLLTTRLRRFFSLSFHDSICTPPVFSTYLRSFRLLAPIPSQSGIQGCLLVRILCKDFHDLLRGKSLNRRLLRLVPFLRSRLTQVPLLSLRHLHLLYLQHYHLPLDQFLNLLSHQRPPMDPQNMLSPTIWLATPSHTH